MRYVIYCAGSIGGTIAVRLACENVGSAAASGAMNILYGSQRCPADTGVNIAVRWLAARGTPRL